MQAQLRKIFVMAIIILIALNIKVNTEKCLQNKKNVRFFNGGIIMKSKGKRQSIL